LLKYGYSNFTLEILEYCEPENALAREQHYLDHLKPEYNILQIALAAQDAWGCFAAGSILGYKQSKWLRSGYGWALK